MQSQQMVYRDIGEESLRLFSDLPNTFLDWFEKCFSEKWSKNVARAKSEYYIRTFSNEKNCEKGVIFFLIDIRGNVRDGKIMYYNRDGHRKRYANWVSAYYKKRGFWSENIDTRKCLFGEHLIRKYNEKTICLVESEKTALICSVLFDEYVWVATGGCGNFKKETASVLRGKRVIVFPDTGEEEKWKCVLDETGGIYYSLVTDFANCAKNTDIVDLLLCRAITQEQLANIININHLITLKKWN